MRIPRSASHPLSATHLLATVIGLAAAGGAQAYEFQIGEINASWSNTLKYSLGSRTGSPNKENLSDVNLDDPE
ncbi:DUF1302 family protein, partial [Klebsiella pneumoniae]|uniref:DUF1302 family protein n=1 Tax=Klebsiella pneumoniae TaxID=573 RepID=UPI00210F0DF3